MSEQREVERWITVNGHRVPIYKKTSGLVITKQQKEWEDSIRNSATEHSGYFDADGNLLFELEGSEEEVTFGGNWEDEKDWDLSVKFNHEVEQRIWKDEKINHTHNHPENTIFSPEDIRAFEQLENYSDSAILPNGTSYRIVRDQPRTSNEYIYDDATKEWRRKFEPKRIADAYEEAYRKVWEADYKKIRNETMWGSPERKRRRAELDKKVAREMEKWLNANAAKYGYRFEVTR